MKRNKRVIKDAKRLFELSVDTTGNLNGEKVSKSVQSIIQSRSREKLPLLKAYKKVIEQYIRAHTATIETAVALDDATISLIAKRFGNNMTIEQKENPALIGGIRLQVNDTIYDDSVLGKLDQIKTQIR